MCKDIGCIGIFSDGRDKGKKRSKDGWELERYVGDGGGWEIEKEKCKEI